MINHPNQYFDESKKFLAGEKRSVKNIFMKEAISLIPFFVYFICCFYILGWIFFYFVLYSRARISISYHRYERFETCSYFQYSFTNIKEEPSAVKTEIKAEPQPPPPEIVDVNFDEEMEIAS